MTDTQADSVKLAGWIVLLVLAGILLNVAKARAEAADPRAFYTGAAQATFITQVPSRHSRELAPDIAAIVSSAAFAAGVPVGMALAVVRHESGGNPNVRGRAGEWGLMQVKCATARGIGFTGPCSALRDPAVNVQYGMAYLARARALAATDCGALAKYNGGLGASSRCTAYGHAVLARM